MSSFTAALAASSRDCPLPASWFMDFDASSRISTLRGSGACARAVAGARSASPSRQSKAPERAWRAPGPRRARTVRSALAAAVLLVLAVVTDGVDRVLAPRGDLAVQAEGEERADE